MKNTIKIIGSILITISIIYIWSISYYISDLSPILLILSSYLVYMFNIQSDISKKIYLTSYIYQEDTLLYKIMTSKIYLAIKGSFYSLLTVPLSLYIFLTLTENQQYIIYLSMLITIVLFLILKIVLKTKLTHKNINFNLVKLIVILSTLIFSYILFTLSIEQQIPELYFKNIDEITYFYKNIVYSKVEYNNIVLSYLSAIDTIIWHYSLLIMSKFNNLNIDKILLIWLTIKNIFVLFTINKLAISSFLYFYKKEDK